MNTALILAITLATSALRGQLIESPSASTPTSAQLAAESIVDAINAEIKHRVDVHRVCFDTLWRNAREGATPAAILQELGARAGQVFQFSNENLQHIQRCAELVGKTRADFIADADCTPPVELVFHTDGTVTIQQP